MKVLILASAMLATLSNSAIARERPVGQDLRDAGVTVVSRDQQAGGAAIRIAMGPTSAAQKNFGAAGTATPPKCSSSVGTCANDRNVKKHSK